MKLTPIVSLTTIGVICTLVVLSCSLHGDAEPTVASTPAPDDFITADLALFELSGKVKKVSTTTYYDVVPGSLAVDSANASHRVIYFDTLGRYVPRRDERIERDEQGRITRWEDHRPNLRRIHGGFLRDTLRYTHLSDNVLQSAGMGDYAVTVYDDRHRIVGQYTDPVADGCNTSVFNVYRDEDPRGNWTERLSVWTTQSAGSRPHVSYALERREVVYY